MKLKSLRNFMMNDSKTGQFIHRKIGELFEMDETKEGELLHDLINMGRVTIADPAFIPDRQEYTGVHQIVITLDDGTPRRIDPGDRIKLSREVAVPLLVSGHIKPSDNSVWTPRKLLQPTVKSGEVKRMFDDPPVERETWTMKGGRR